MPYLETSADMNDDHNLCHTDDPYWVAQGVHDLAAGLAAKGMVPRKAHSKVAVSHKSVCDPHTKLQQIRKHVGVSVSVYVCLCEGVCACRAFVTNYDCNALRVVQRTGRCCCQECCKISNCSVGHAEGATSHMR